MKNDLERLKKQTDLLNDESQKADITGRSNQV